MLESKLFRSIHSHFNHITWFRNSASVSLLATLSHRTWVANDFSSSQFSQKRSKRLRLHFLKIFLQTKNFFLTHLLYAKSTFNSDRKLYRERWCDQMRTWLFNSHWNLIHYWASQITVAKRVNHCHEMIQIALTNLCHEVIQIALTNLCREIR
jgi:hypothetical protein